MVKKNKEKIMRKNFEERFGEVNNYELYPPLPRKLNIELNNTCNHKCEFCLYHGKYAKNKLQPSIMDPDFAKRILLRAKELGIGQKEVGFYLAGEAFCYSGLVEIIAYAKELGYEYTFLTTNGALATPDKLKAVIDAGLDSIRFSVNAADKDSYREIHGSDDFDNVVSNIKFLHKYISEKQLNVATSLSCVITKKTLGIKNAIRELFSEYVDDILFIPVFFAGLKDLPEVREQYEVINDDELELNENAVCPVVYDTMYINALGQVVPCCNAYTYNLYFYDLKQEFDLEKAWYSEGYLKYRKVFLEHSSYDDTICGSCYIVKKGVQRLMMEEE